MKVVTGEKPRTDEWRGFGGVHLEIPGLTIPVDRNHVDVEADRVALRQGRLAAG